MLDGFEVLTTSGIVLWSRSYTPISASIINGFIKDIFIEERIIPGAGAGANVDVSAAKNPSYSKGQYTLKWATVKDLGLIFVVSFETIKPISRVTSFTGCLHRPFTNLSFISPGLTNF